MDIKQRLTLKEISTLVISLFVVIGIVDAIRSCGRSSQESHTTAVPDSSTPSPIAPQAALVGDALKQAYSSYITELVSAISALDVARVMYSGRLKQDAQFSDLSALRTDAEHFKDSMQQNQATIFTLQIPDNLSDENAQLFSNPKDIASDIATDAVTVAVDFAVQADTGMSDDEPAQIINAMPAKSRALKRSIMKGYAAFGVPPGAVDKSTYQIKEPEIVAPKPE